MPELRKLVRLRKLVISCAYVRFRDGYAVLKRFLLIFSDLIFESRVDPGIPNLAAAPDGPDTRPPDSRRATSIISFSWATSIRDSSRCPFGSLATDFRESQLSSTEKFSVSHTMSDRSITFCNSRMLPGQGYDWSNCRVFLSTLRMLLPALRA